MLRLSALSAVCGMRATIAREGSMRYATETKIKNARSSHATAAQLSSHACSHNSELRREVARNPNTHTSVLRRLADDRSAYVRRAVANIVRMTSRFAYVTTRCHPNPVSLLDFTTQFDVDPTHITLLNKDMLRLMFVLEGCRSRPDLEARMDWGGKGRVLVLEKLTG